MTLTKKERQARDRAALKCWCGNVAGLGQTLCGKHREEEQAPLAGSTDPAALVTSHKALVSLFEQLFECGDVQLMFAGNPKACEALEAECRAALTNARAVMGEVE